MALASQDYAAKHNSYDAQAVLEAHGIVIGDVLLNHPGQLLPAGKTSAIVTLTLEDPPKTFHGAVVDALANTRHTLGHACRCQLVVEHTGRILESPVTVKKGMCFWVRLHRLIEGIVYQCAVVGIPNYKGNHPSVAQIQYGAEVNFVHRRASVILELGDIRQPFFVWLVRMEAAAQQVLRGMLRGGGPFC